MTQLSDIQSGFAVTTRLLIAAVLLLACEKNTAPPAESAERFGTSDEPAFAIGTFFGMRKADKDPMLPVLVEQAGDVSADCFQLQKKASTWQTADPRVPAVIKDNESAVIAAVLAWITETLQPTDKARFADPSGWRIEIAKPMVRHVFPSEIRLTGFHTCINDTTRDFALGARTITTAFGSRDLTLTSPAPIPGDQLRAMRATALQQKVRLVPVNAYTPALDATGKQRRGAKKEKLFNSPSGELIPEKKVPPPKSRDARAFRLVFTDPLFFAEGDLPAASWKKENSPETCEVFLVYYDALPQVPECPEFSAAGFGAAPSKKPGHVIIKAAGLKATTETETAFGTVTSMTVDGNIQLWVTATPVEEGARLKIDSLVLDTGNGTPRIASFPRAENHGTAAKSTKNKQK